MAVLVAGTSLAALVERLGGALPSGERGLEERRIVRAAPLEEAGEGDLAPLLRASRLEAAQAASARGATLLVAADLATRAPAGWRHAHAAWALAHVLDTSSSPLPPPIVGEGSSLGPGVVLHPGVVVGRNVRVGPNAVVGGPGFGWATGPDGATRAVPQLGGVVIEDDVSLGPLCTVDAGTLSPTRIARGAKLDAHVHVGHNAVVGAGCILAAQVGLAGSVTLGRGVLVGGQAGFADHVTVGDFAKIAAKSGVIGDVPAGATVAGYPAVSRMRWLRALAWLHRAAERA